MRHRQELAGASSVSYDNVDAPVAAPAGHASAQSITVGDDGRRDQKLDADAKAKVAAFEKDARRGRWQRAGYPAKADPIAASTGRWTIVGILTILVIYVTMVYGPIAAMLVEMFPTRIRYTSMSLPYHIGNGWFGGFLPATAFAIVAAHGQHLLRPVVSDRDRGDDLRDRHAVRPETKDVDIYANDR